MQGNSGIISKADESKSQTERKEVIEKAKMTISEKVVNNGGNELTRSELKEILEQYFINVPEDYTLETILKTKEENGKYEIKVSEIYDRDIMTENEETDGSTEVVPPTSSTNVENGNVVAIQEVVQEALGIQIVKVHQEEIVIIQEIVEIIQQK